MAKRFDVFTVNEKESNGEKKNFWTKLGVAFENKDGSLSVFLDGLPLNGKLQIREPKSDGGFPR